MHYVNLKNMYHILKYIIILLGGNHTMKQIVIKEPTRFSPEFRRISGEISWSQAKFSWSQENSGEFAWKLPEFRRKCKKIQAKNGQLFAWIQAKVAWNQAKVAWIQAKVAWIQAKIKKSTSEATRGHVHTWTFMYYKMSRKVHSVNVRM